MKKVIHLKALSLVSVLYFKHNNRLAQLIFKNLESKFYNTNYKKEEIGKEM